jgi:hypothetical protein
MPRITTRTASQDWETTAWSDSSIFTTPWQPFIRANGWTRRKLARYRSYPKLYGKRKFAHNFPLKSLRIVELLPDVRNNIYRSLLVFDQAIELAPKSSIGDRSAALFHHLSIYAREIKPRLRLLRTSKQTNSETASIFYGENEFRFS